MKSDKSKASAPKRAALDLEDSGFFVLRTPLLPADELVAWGDGLQAREAADSGAASYEYEEAWAADVRALRSRLRALIERPEVIHALYVASPSLLSGLEYWKRDPDSKKGLQAERALVRYFGRMCARSTPFGLFSGCSLGRIPDAADGEPELLLEARSSYRPCSRLDFDYLFAMTAQLRRDPAIASHLRYWPNSSLRRIADAWHYTESRLQGSKRSHHLVKVQSDQYVEAVLERARTGATVAELVETVLQAGDDPDLTREEATAYIHELFDTDLLVSSLAPSVTGGSPLDDIIDQLQALPCKAPASDLLLSVRHEMAAVDARGLGIQPEAYRAIQSKLEGLSAKVDPSMLFQVDMTKPVRSAVLTKPVLDELTRALDVVSRFSSGGDLSILRQFREAFTARYERARIPLLEALDEEAGIAFGSTGTDSSPLLRGLQIGSGSAGSGGSAQNLMLGKLFERAPLDTAEIVLDSADLPPADGARMALPDAFAFTATLVAESIEALRKGDFQVVFRGLSGPDGARLLGRFCHADPELDQCVRNHLRQEEAHRPDAVFAEIVHLPEGRIGNVLCRPVLREYELVYLGRSGAPVERQLPMTDLLVSVEGDRIVLYSERLGREVIPRLTNAHGYMNPRLACVYRFLCHLQHQRASIPGFSWGAADGLQFLPRVRIGRIVLATALWRLSKREMDEITKAEGSGRFLKVQELRRRRGLPRWVLFEESDHTLPVDLDNPLSVDALLHVMKRASHTVLREMYPPPDQLCVSGPEGRFCHELNIPFVRRPRASEESTTDSSRPAFASSAPLVDRAVRVLGPGSEWQYVKLYGGPGMLDDVLTTVLPPILRTGFEAGILSRWFFLRYGDPHQHLRIRFNGNPDKLGAELGPILTRAFAPMLSSGRIWKMQFDTYEREIERYGGIEATIIAEDIFFADSAAVVEVLRTLEGDEGLDARWRMALVGIDRMLSDLGFDLSAKRQIMGRMRDGNYKEFQVGVKTKHDLGERFRSERRSLEGLLFGPPQGGSAEIARKAYDFRSSRLKLAAEALRSLRESGRLQAELSDLAPSYVHMHVNRLIRSSPRQHELVLYDFLYRLYDGRLARKQADAPEPATVTVAAE